MGDFNKVMILGRITRDIEVRYTPSGTPVCDMGIAVNRRVPTGDGSNERKEETTYVDVTLWRRQAELAGQYLSKGREVFIEGHLVTESWEDRNTGQKRSRMKVVCDNMQFVGGGGGGQGNSNQGGYQPASQNSGQSQAPSQGYQQSAPAQQQPQQQSAPPAEPSFQPEDEDDIPF